MITRTKVFAALGVMCLSIVVVLGLLFFNGYDESDQPAVAEIPNLDSFREGLTAYYTDGDKAVDYVLANAETMSPLHLLAGASTAYQLGRLQDAAFLLYAGRIRARYDLQRYEPKQTGGDSPAVAFGCLIENVSVPVIRDITLRSKDYSQMTERLEAWNIRVPADYDPGWPYKQQETPADLFANLKEASLGDAKKLAVLLNIPEYVAAMNVARAFNELPPEQQADKAAKDRYLKASQTMHRIEKENHVESVPDEPLEESE